MIIQCEICEKEFYIRPAHFKRNKRHFCSNKCKGIGQSEKNNPAWKDSWVKKCQNCGKEYRFKDGRGAKFCSQKCMGQFKSEHNSKIVICVICGNKFKKINSGIKKENSCSRKCANILHSIRMQNKGNPNWRNGIKNLPWAYSFNKKLKNKIKKRDNYICKVCGKKDCILQIHHIDYNKMNSDENNLISLCCSCHCKTNYNRKIWKEKLLKILND